MVSTMQANQEHRDQVLIAKAEELVGRRSQDNPD